MSINLYRGLIDLPTNSFQDVAPGFQVNANKKMTPTHRSFALKLKGRGEFRQERKADGVYYHGLQLNAIWRQRMLDEAFAGYGE